MAPSPLVIAHRGAHGDGVVENTLTAFEAALDAGADMIEFDVRRTAGDELIVIHGRRYAGVAVDSVSLDELEARTGFRPPLLVEVLDWAAGRIALDVELKEDGYVEQVAELLLAFGEDPRPPLVTSFIDPVLAQLATLAPSLPTGLLLAFTSKLAVERARACGAQALLPERKLAREQLIMEAADTSLEMIVWDFMPSDGAALVADSRIAGVITDDVPGSIALRGSPAP